MKRAKSAFHFLRKVIESVLARESLPDKATSLKKQKTKNKEKTIRSKNNDWDNKRWYAQNNDNKAKIFEEKQTLSL